MQSVATYGLELYTLKENESPPKARLNDWQLIINEQARRATGAFKTTNTGILMVEGAMKPAEAMYERRSLRFCQRQLSRPSTNSKINESQSHENLERRVRAKCRFKLRVSDIEPTDWDRGGKSIGHFIFESRNDAKTAAQKPISKGELRFFTDGSKLENGGTGAGVIRVMNDGELAGRSFTLGSNMEAFDGELLAIYLALESAGMEVDESTKKITIYSDSTSALHRIRSDKEGPGQAMSREIRELEEVLGDSVPVEYHWVPGHENIPGNEEADIYARNGALGNGISTVYPGHEVNVNEMTSWAHVNRLVTEKAAAAARTSIKTKLKGNKAYRFIRRMGIRTAFKPNNDGRATIGKKHTAVFTQMAIGHALTADYLYRFKQRSTNKCWWCSDNVRQTRGHLFGRCSRFKSRYRQLVKECNMVRKRNSKPFRRYWDVRQFFEEEGYELPVINYMRDTGIGYGVPQEESSQSDSIDEWVGDFPFVIWGNM